MLITALFGPQDIPDSFEYELDGKIHALFRPLKPEDTDRLQAGFQRLSKLARRRRFMESDDSLSPELVDALTSSDMKNSVAWGAMNLDKPDEPGIGIGRYVRLTAEPDAADVAITVADDYQGKGAGTVLHACLHLTAANNGIDTFYYDAHPENERFIHQIKDLGGEYVGTVVNVTRLKLNVFARGSEVPNHKETGQKLRAAFRWLSGAKSA